MRELTIAECEVASGGHGHTQECGWGSACNNPGDITVEPDQWEWWDWGAIGGGYGGNNGGGGGGGGSDPNDDPNCTCGDNSTGPAPDADKQTIDNIVNYLANLMKNLPSNLEHSAFIFKTADGTLSYSNILTGTLNNTPPMSSALLPDGATLVAWIHSHPADAGTDQRFPSSPGQSYGPDDWSGVDALIAGGAANPRYDVDPNMLLFILDTASGKTFEYDVNDRDNVTPGEERDCPIH